MQRIAALGLVFVLFIPSLLIARTAAPRCCCAASSGSSCPLKNAPSPACHEDGRRSCTMQEGNPLETASGFASQAVERSFVPDATGQLAAPSPSEALTFGRISARALDASRRPEPPPPRLA
jgi:hypothetical protein